MNIRNHLHEPGLASRHGRSVLRILGLTLGGIAFAVFFAFLFGIVVKLLWNWLMPALFGLGAITFWQAFGIVLLAKILFGGHGPGSSTREKRHERFLRDKFHTFTGAGEDGPGAGHLHGDARRWRHFREFWQDEGKAAFEAYIKKMEDRE